MKFKKDYVMSDFDKWLFQVPWRLERYHDLVPGFSEENKQQLRNDYEWALECVIKAVQKSLGSESYPHSQERNNA